MQAKGERFMSRPSLFSYLSAAASVNPKQLTILVEYLIRNTDVFLDTSEMNALFRSKSVVTTPISRIYQRLIETNEQGIFSPIRFRSGVHTINEVAASRHLTLDMLQAIEVVTPATAGAISVQPNLNKKIILNITQFTKASGDVSDTLGLQSVIVRDLLSRSFFTDTRTTWMTPNLTHFVCKVYSMTLGSSVASWYNLDYKTQTILNTLFAFFFLSAMSDDVSAANTLKTKYRYFGLPDSAEDLDQIFALIAMTLQKPTLDSLDDVCTVIDALGVERIRINRQILNTRLKSLGPDILTTAIALEYPPYFTYLILLVLSGSKIGLSYRLKSFNLMKEASVFVSDLIQTSSFIGSLSQ